MDSKEREELCMELERLLSAHGHIPSRKQEILDLTRRAVEEAQAAERSEPSVQREAQTSLGHVQISSGSASQSPPQSLSSGTSHETGQKKYVISEISPRVFPVSGSESGAAADSAHAQSKTAPPRAAAKRGRTERGSGTIEKKPRVRTYQAGTLGAQSRESSTTSKKRRGKEPQYRRDTEQGTSRAASRGRQSDEKKSDSEYIHIDDIVDTDSNEDLDEQARGPSVTPGKVERTGHSKNTPQQVPDERAPSPGAKRRSTGPTVPLSNTPQGKVDVQKNTSLHDESIVVRRKRSSGEAHALDDPDATVDAEDTGDVKQSSSTVQRKPQRRPARNRHRDPLSLIGLFPVAVQPQENDRRNSGHVSLSSSSFGRS